jgi:serine/threonine protein kinase
MLEGCTILEGCIDQQRGILQGVAVSSECSSFMHDCLQTQPEARPAVADLLQHPWITMHCMRPADIERRARSLSAHKISDTQSQWVATLEAMGGLSSS